jgi:hypothetical protein
MKRRGPPVSKQSHDHFAHDSTRASHCQIAVVSGHHDPYIHAARRTPSYVSPPLVGSTALYRQVSAYPRHLTHAEAALLDHYIQGFSRQYPTCSGPSNPFLSILLPLAMSSEVVLDSLLALSGAQGRWEAYTTQLELRQRALRGCRVLLDNTPYQDWTVRRITPRLGSEDAPAQPVDSIPSQSPYFEKLLYALASAVLFLLYDKVSAEPTWRAHMRFIGHVFGSIQPTLLNYTSSTDTTKAIQFLHDIFVYNDIVQATSMADRPQSEFYLTFPVQTQATTRPPTGHHPWVDRDGRYIFPNLIARLSLGDPSVTEKQILSCKDTTSWLPSYMFEAAASKKPESTVEIWTGNNPPEEQDITSELYRVAAMLYRRQTFHRFRLLDSSMCTGRVSDSDSSRQLAGRADALMNALPRGSNYESALLWPMGIFAKELTPAQDSERLNVLRRLQWLEKRFRMRHFTRVRQILSKHWTAHDSRLWSKNSDMRLTADDILIG